MCYCDTWLNLHGLSVPKQKLISKSEFARTVGVSAAAITKASMLKGALRPAMEGKRVNVAHRAAIEYAKRAIGRATSLRLTNGHTEPLQTPTAKPSSTVKKQKRSGLDESDTESEPQGTIDIPEDIQEFAHFTIADVVDKFGTDQRFVDFLAAIQKIEAINEKRLKNAQTKGELISRDLVERGVIDVFNSAHIRLLKDGAKSIAAGAISKHASGAEVAEIEAFVSDILGSFIRPIKNKITRSLRNV